MANHHRIDPKVVLGVPTLADQPLNWEWVDYFQSLAFPLGTSVAKTRIHGRIVADARNEIVAQALGCGADYVFFISDDVLAPSRAFEYLWRHKKDMVTGVYWSKYHPPLPYLWKGLLDGPYTDWTYGEFFEIDWAGCDCLLVHTDVFKAIEPPWFSHDWSYKDGQPAANLATEDLYFYTKARKAGFKLFCDSAVQCDHIDRTTGLKYGLTVEMPQYTGRKEKWRLYDEGTKVADLGSGMDTPFFGEGTTVIRIDGDPKGAPDIQCDLRAIPVEAETFDVIHARHVLEHFDHREIPGLLKEWLRILKIGGEVIINVPDIAVAAAEILKADADPNYDATYAFWQVYGLHQTGEPNEYHKCGHTQNGLMRLLSMFPQLSDVTVAKVNGVNLEARAKKVKSSKPYPIIENWSFNGNTGTGDDAGQADPANNDNGRARNGRGTAGGGDKSSSERTVKRPAAKKVRANNRKQRAKTRAAD